MGGGDCCELVYKGGGEFTSGGGLLLSLILDCKALYCSLNLAVISAMFVPWGDFASADCLGEGCGGGACRFRSWFRPAEATY